MIKFFQSRIARIVCVLLTAGLFSLAFSGQALSQHTPDQLTKIVKLINDNIRPWAEDNFILEAIKKQNAAHTALTDASIKQLDNQWIAELKQDERPLITKIITNELSRHLKEVKKASNGLFTEIIVMDNKGLVAGASDATSDYWQGDEAKWLETFQKDARAIHVSDVDLDESTQIFQFQVSITLSDHGTPIGAVTVGVDTNYFGY